jgi:hypothetical protein
MGSRWPARFGSLWRRRSAVVLAGTVEARSGEIDWDEAPGAGARTHCLFCFSVRPTTIYCLDEGDAVFRDATGATYVLPRFVPVCAGCERLSTEGQYAVLAQLMRVQNPYEDEADNIVATFHRATRASRPVGE